MRGKSRARVVGVVLSGGGDDGVTGAIAIKAAGGLTIVQEPGEAVSRWMPTTALLYDRVDAVLSLARLATSLSVSAVEVERPGQRGPVGRANGPRVRRIRQAADGDADVICAVIRLSVRATSG